MSSAGTRKPHVVCIPFPAQGHITPMLALAKLLHASGFHITFVNTEYNHRRLLRSHGKNSLTDLPDFQFKTIPDGLPFCADDKTRDILSLCLSINITCLPHLKDLLDRLNKSCSGIPRVTCVIADSTMNSALDVAECIGAPTVLLWTGAACGFMGFLQYRQLISRGLVPLKDSNQLSNGFLDTPVDSVPSMNNMRLRDFPTFIRTTDLNDPMLNSVMHTMERQSMAYAIIINTFDELEHTVLDALKSTMTPPMYTIGPLQLLTDQIVTGSPLISLSSNLWKEEPACLAWLEAKKARSVLYVNFGSLAVLTNQQLVEFAWGLANSKYEFLWIIRPDLVRDSSTAMLPQEFLEEVKERGLLASWCPQMAVLGHEAIGLFLTHSGWNSTLESISNGVPMLSWPVAADQQTNCRYVCTEWQVGMEIDNDVKREEVERLIREVMEGEEGKKMKERTMEWKESAIRATQHGGSSFLDFQKLLQEVLIPRKDSYQL